ncbi:MAG TPA: TMEM43 family protein [Kiritimatiellia bacterium]|nr:TMEM43 family protein [Kiritimatiellia bacterium]HRU70964.1 TMEM43 family protein [Kiritimatiellia bacterium]
MAYIETTEVQNPNWLSRMGSSIKGVLVGAVLFLVAFPILFWNEGRAVKTAKGLSEGASAVVDIGIDAVDATNEGRLVHVSGRAETDETLSDETFGVAATALRLNRSVEIYQWVEHKDVKREKKGDKTIETTTYTYKTEWCGQPVDSSGFKESGHDNPPVAMPFSSQEQVAKDVKLGAFRLTERHVKKIGGAKPFPFPQDFRLPATLPGGQYLNGDIFIASSLATNDVRQVATNPQIGDLRIRFSMVEPHDISLCEKQTGDTFSPWTASNGKTFSLQEDGIVDAAAMFASAQRANKLMTWVLRLIGFVVMLVGVRMILAPFSVLVDVIPVVRTIVSMGVGLIAFLVAAIGSLLVVAVAWFFFRPILSIALIVLAAACIVGLIMLKKKKAA